MRFLFLLVLSSFLFLSILPAHAKRAECDKYRKKLDNIKSQQRMGNTVKRSNKLKEREEKAYKTWRQCEQGKMKKTGKKDN